MKTFYIFILVLLLGCDKDPDNIVEYNVVCNSCSVSYMNGSGWISYDIKDNNPWHYYFNGKPGDLIYLNVKNNLKSGLVTAVVKLNKDKFLESSDSLSVSVSGKIPKISKYK
jgi:hypothetical protein